MKSRSSSPQTSPQVMRRYRVDSKDVASVTASSPRKSSRLFEQPSTSTTTPTPSMNGLQPYNGTPTSTTTREPSPGLLSPVSHNVRRFSSEQPHTTPSRPTPYTLSPSPSSGGPPPSGTSENDAPWSSAIGHATTAGKSGRVIERLMAENDRLKRELELSLLKVQELERSAQTYAPQLEAMRETIDSLSHVRDMDSTLISRRDRKIEELKAEVVGEREGKSVLGRRLREVERGVEEMEGVWSRERQGLVERERHACVHAEILETSHRQLAAEYKARRAVWERELGVVREEREEDRRRVERLDVVCEQMRAESERTRRVQAEMVARWEEVEEDMRKVGEEGEEANERVRKKSVEMEKVVGEMRWLMGVERNSQSKSSRKDGVALPVREARK